MPLDWPVIALGVVLLLNLLGLVFMAWRQRRLTQSLRDTRQALQREIAQVNSAAMGVGRHLMSLEQHRREPATAPSAPVEQGVNHYGQLAGLDYGEYAVKDPMSTTEMELQALIAAARPAHH